ncbi:MAG: hypothetical protein JNJ83_23060 [Verrucomicrobiaceae bacterium]|nr:hypothetical protein [Verrucomicrobiaceae bacterium]
MKSLAYRISLVGIVALSGKLQAQQPNQYAPPSAGNRWDGFYQKGDAMSEKVSGFMRRIFGGGTAPRTSYSQPSYTTAQPQYQQPAVGSRSTVQSTPAQSTGVYGYSTPATSSTSNNRTASQRTSPVAPARKNTSSSANKPLLPIYREKTKPSTSAPQPSSSGYYEPPKINNQPPAPVETPKTVKSDPPMQTASETVNSFKSPDSLEPGTLVDNSPVQEKKSKSLSSIFTNEPSSTKTVVESPPPPPAPEPTKPETTKPTSSFTDDTPVGKKGSKPGRVISPYPPHNELDVSGLDSGSMALDPTTNRVFRIP